MRKYWHDHWGLVLLCLFAIGISECAIASESEGYDDRQEPPTEPPPHDHDVINAVSSSIATGGEATGGTGGNATGGVGGESSSRSDSGSTISIIEEHPDDIKIKNTPSTRAPYANSTSPCRVGGSFGLALPGLGASGGGSKEDKECTLRQTAQTFSSMGVPAMGLWILCRSKVLERVGSDPDGCDAMVAQFQIEASFDSPGKH